MHRLLYDHLSSCPFSGSLVLTLGSGAWHSVSFLTTRWNCLSSGSVGQLLHPLSNRDPGFGKGDSLHPPVLKLKIYLLVCVTLLMIDPHLMVSFTRSQAIPSVLLQEAQQASVLTGHFIQTWLWFPLSPHSRRECWEPKPGLNVALPASYLPHAAGGCGLNWANRRWVLSAQGKWLQAAISTHSPVLGPNLGPA